MDNIHCAMTGDRGDDNPQAHAKSGNSCPSEQNGQRPAMDTKLDLCCFYWFSFPEVVWKRRTKSNSISF